MRPSRSFVVVLAAVNVFFFAGCTRPNPDFCCVTAETCAAAGLGDERRPCDVGQACKSYGCVAAECSSSADCASPEAPTCLDGLCVAGCAVDDDCAGVAGTPRCDAADATCVGCLSNDQCSASQPICDADARSCRGCTADDECASGVCIEAAGTCAADSEIIYVVETGVDAGTCPKSAPCKTMQFAMGLTSPIRNVIRVLGGYFYLGNSSVHLTDSVIIDGSNTTLTYGFSPPITSSGPGTLEGVRLTSTDTFAPLIKVSTGGTLKLVQAMVDRGQIEVIAGGTLDAFDITLRNSNIECKSGGNLSVRRSHLEQSLIDSSCKLHLSASRLQPVPGSVAFPPLRFMGSMQMIENNVFIETNTGGTLMFILGSAGSKFRFNTVVNTSPIIGTTYAIGCADGVDVTSNIIAYNSTAPISCVARYSLFDTAGMQEINRGIGNVSGDVTAFFRDRQAGDFRLSSNSPALGIGEPGLVTTDLDGNARPIPAGSLPDVGAYEAP